MEASNFALTVYTIIAVAVGSVEMCFSPCHPRRQGYLRSGYIHRFHRGPRRDHVYFGRDLRNETTHSYLTCAGLCLQDDACRSFNFCQDDQRCELNSDRFVEGVSVWHPSSGCFYFDEGACTVTTLPTTPSSYRFVLPEQIAPFRLPFTVRASTDVLLLLQSTQPNDVSFKIDIGYNWDKTSRLQSGNHLVFHEEAGLLSEFEDRAFWIEYTRGLLRVGKGTGDDAYAIHFMQLEVDIKTAPSKVNIGISTWQNVQGEWKFAQACR